MIPDGSSAFCGIANLAVTPNAFGCSDIGMNTVTLVGTDALGVTNDCQATVTVVGIIPVVAIDTSELPGFCQDGLITITATPDSGYYFSYAWSTGENTQSINIDTSGSYSVVVTNNYGCTVADTVDVSYTRHELRSAYTIMSMPPGMSSRAIIIIQLRKEPKSETDSRNKPWFVKNLFEKKLNLR